MITSSPDLDDKILHYVLIGGTLFVYHSLKYALDWVVAKEFKFIRKAISIFRKKKQDQ